MTAQVELHDSGSGAMDDKVTAITDYCSHPTLSALHLVIKIV